MASDDFVDQFKEIAEVTNDIIWIRPANTRQLIYISPSFERITGRSVETVYRRPFTLLDSVTISDRKAVWAIFAEFTTENTSLQFTYKDRYGRVLWGKSRVYTTYDAAGSPRYRVGIITDITAEIEQQIRLQKDYNRQQEICRVKSTFISDASHELRTPISSIFSGLELIELLSEKVPDSPASLKIGLFARQTRQEIKRLNTLIGDISMLEKYSSGEFKAHSTAFELVAFCEKVIGRIQSENTSKQRIVFTSAISEQLVNLDITLLEQCVARLLSNALKYSVRSKAAVQVDLSQTDYCLQLIVKDYGIGIPTEELTKVGTHFFRASNSIGITGSGLGLVFVKLFSQLLGGQVKIDSELNKWTRCTLEIPFQLTQ